MNILPVSYAEILKHGELLSEYAAECSIPEIGKFNPQADLYAKMEATGLMKCFGVFADGKLVGFASLLIWVVPHYGQKIATLESIFIASAYRHGSSGGKLMDEIEQYAKENGCKVIQYSARVGSRFQSLLSRLTAYQHTNDVFTKSL